MLENKLSSPQEKPTIKCRVRNFLVLHLIRDGERTIYEKDDLVWLTPTETKQYQHLIEVVS